MKAFVLKKIPYGESDLIVRFLLETGEVASAFAAGARHSKKRFPHQFHLTGLYELAWTRADAKERLSRLQRCDLIDFHSPLSDSMELLCRWSMVLEWISLDDEHLFDFQEVSELRSSLDTSLLRYFLFFIGQMKVHGIHPELENCVHCGKAINAEARFSFQEGGVLHLTCGHGNIFGLEARTFLVKALSGEIVFQTEMGSLLELDEIILPFLEWQLGRSLKSRKVFLESFRQIRPRDAEREVSADL